MSNTTSSICEENYMSGKLSRKMYTACVAVVVVLAQIVAPARIALAANESQASGAASGSSKVTADAAHEKVWVCKYSAKPNDGEKAQTVLSVDWQPDREPGMVFNDAQSLSYVIDYDTGQPKPDKNTACPVLIAIPAAPSITDPCGSGNATWNVPADTDQLDWTLNPDGTLSVMAKTGYMFLDGTFVHNYGLPTETNTTACPITKIDPPTTPSVTDPCNVTAGSLNATWVVPADTTAFDWELGNDGHLRVTILTANTTFKDGTTTYDYGLATQYDNKIVCAPTGTPTASDTCGTKNDKYTIPSTTGIEYRINNVAVAAGTYSAVGMTSVTVTAVALTGYELQGTASWTLTFSDQRCTPNASVSVSTYCAKDGQNFNFSVTNTTDSLQRYILVVTDGNGNEVERSPGFDLSSGSNTSGFWSTSTDGTYTFTLYAVDASDVIIGDALWEATATTQCAHDVFTPNIFKVDQSGNVFTGPLFTIEVCMYDNESEDWGCQTYSNVNLGTDGKWFASNVEYEPYTDMKVTITETSTLQGCTLAGPWTATWNYPEEDSDNITGAWTGDFTSNTWKLVNVCTPGKGGETPVPPVKTVAPVPAELPHTGPTNLTGVYGMILALLTYGIVYFAQPKRQEEL